jgi:hypothetical protein
MTWKSGVVGAIVLNGCLWCLSMALSDCHLVGAALFVGIGGFEVLLLTVEFFSVIVFCSLDIQY